ncbi:MMPL family transporter [Phaeospirillum tilakii]|uniref:MMPL family transporter n=1 Tax=Phaeospirillum tilakii TaxID=741673 RepID=A0ABW5CC62_9PROT
MARRLAVFLVDWCWRHAWAVVTVALLATAGLGYYAATHLSLDTDESKLIAGDLPFRQAEATIDAAFPHTLDRLVVVLDAATPEAAEEGVERLAAALEARHDPAIRSVSRPAEEVFFRRYGLMFLSPTELSALSDRLMAAQPLLGTVARDPSLRGLVGATQMILEGVARHQAAAEEVEPLLQRLDRAAGALAEGRAAEPADWQSLAAAGPGRDTPSRVLLVQVRLDHAELQSGAAGTAAIHAAAAAAGVTPDQGYRLRLTGSVALTDANFATVTEGVGLSAPLSLLAVLVLLFWGVRSFRVVAAIMISLAVGLVATAAFAAATVGSLNPISVAFAVMFVGIAVDFAIQFVISFRNERYRLTDAAPAVRSAAGLMAAPLSLAALATAVGFLSFLPTAYTGVSQLGLIAGGGMVIALVVDFTLLPALLALIKPPSEPEPVGLKLAAADRFLARRARPVVWGAGLIAATGAALLPALPLDFDPLHLQNPKAEAVATFQDLARDPESGVYAVEILAPSLGQAHALAERLDALPGVRRTMTLESFLPPDQDQTLPILADMAQVLGPTLDPAQVLPPPDAAATAQAMVALARQLEAVLPGDQLARDLAAHLDAVAAAGPDKVRAFDHATAAGLSGLIVGLRASLVEVRPLTLETLPADLTRNWLTPDGRARVQAVPRENMADAGARARFVDAITALAPDAAGSPISMELSGRVVVHAFAIAALAALVGIGLMLAVMLRRLLDTLLVLAPLLIGALATVIVCWTFGLAINFANIIALPLLLGIGVAFNIYFVVNWRNGVTEPLQTPTTRAVLFSALTTGSAFGSLAVSPHLGTASMGLLLFVSLALSVLATFVVLPALCHLLGKAKS